MMLASTLAHGTAATELALLAQQTTQQTPLTDSGEWIVNVFFWGMAAVAIIAALKMVTTTNIVHAALYLLVVLSVVAGTYVILGAEFAAVTQVLVYLGAVMVLLLFGVMLTRAKLGSEDDLDHEQRWVGALVAAAMFAVMSYSTWEAFDSQKLPAEQVPQNTQQVADEIFSTYIVPFEALSVLLLAALIGAIVVARRD
jgi:NADH-quinone oxidoreductase subunit J